MKQRRVACRLFLCALWCFLSGFATPLSASPLLEVRVKGITMDPAGQSPVVILETRDGRHALPIWIGMSEARAIALEMERVAACARGWRMMADFHSGKTNRAPILRCAKGGVPRGPTTSRPNCWPLTKP